MKNRSNCTSTTVLQFIGFRRSDKQKNIEKCLLYKIGGKNVFPQKNFKILGLSANLGITILPFYSLPSLYHLDGYHESV